MRLLCNIPNPADGTSLYRGIGPLGTMARAIHLDLNVNENHDWKALKGADAVFFQRPYLEAHMDAMRYAKLNKKKVWVDFDDNLFCVPLCNRRYLVYNYPQAHHAIATMTALADVVSVTTEHLAEVLRSVIKQFPDNGEFIRDPNKIRVVPNAYDPELHPVMPCVTGEREPRQKLITWRGSDSHAKDLWTHTEQICNVIRDNPDWRFEFIGEPFWMTIEAVKKVAKPQTVSVTAAMDPVRYFDYLKKTAPALVIVPLEDQAFNRSKSNIAWIEATAAGAATLAPDTAEWHRPGIINYKNPEDFGKVLQDFVNGHYEPDVRWGESRDYIQENLCLYKVNQKRLDILASLDLL